jgi:hypothetical protein
MLTYAITAQVTGAAGLAAAWAQQMATLVRSKTGATVNVSARHGGQRQIIWICQYEDFASFERAQAILGADEAYETMVRSAADASLFDPLSVDTAFWIPV